MSKKEMVRLVTMHVVTAHRSSAMYGFKKTTTTTEEKKISILPKIAGKRKLP